MHDGPKKDVINYQLRACDFTLGQQGEQPKAKRQRKPTLRAALEAAQKAGRSVKSATIEDGKVTLVFGEPTPESSIDEWDERLNRGKH